MGTGVSVAQSNDNADITKRIQTANEIRMILSSSEDKSVVLEQKSLGEGMQSFVRTVRISSLSDGAESFAAVLKCAHPSDEGWEEYNDAAEKFESLVASLASRLVMSKISPHFSILYKLGVNVDDTPCKILERHSHTLLECVKEVLCDKSALYSLFAQITHGLLAASTFFGFTHNDLLLRNIMGDRVNKDVCYAYVIDDQTYGCKSQ